MEVLRAGQPEIARLLPRVGEDLDLSPAPVLGEHTREILNELGFTSERIETLLGEGVIRSSD